MPEVLLSDSAALTKWGTGSAAPVDAGSGLSGVILSEDVYYGDFYRMLDRASLALGNGLRVYASDVGASKVGVYPGITYWNGSTIAYAGTDGTVTCTDNATSYVWMTPAGAIAEGSAWPTVAHKKLASVVMVSGAITTITDYRGAGWFAGLGGSTAAAGSTYSDATALPAGTAGTYPVTAADGTKGVIVTTTDKVTGRRINVANLSSAVLKVYGPAGAVINGGSANAGISSASGKGVVLECIDSTANTWMVW